MTQRVIAIGDLSVDQICSHFSALPEWGQEVEYRSREKRLGGNVGNFAVSAKKLGMDLDCLCPIGGDDNGRWIESQLADIGIQNSNLSRYGEEATCVSTALVHVGGERLFFTHAGALGRMQDMLMDYRPPEAVAAIFTGWCQPPRVSPEVLLECFSRLRKNGTNIYFDLSWFDPSWQAPEQVIGVMAHTHTAMMNEDEAEALTGSADPATAANQLFRGDSQPTTLVIKCGRRGAIIKEIDKEPIKIKGVRNRNVSNTVGAGDAFNAAFVYAREYLSLAIEDAASYACKFATEMLVTR